MLLQGMDEKLQGSLGGLNSAVQSFVDIFSLASKRNGHAYRNAKISSEVGGTASIPSLPAGPASGHPSTSLREVFGDLFHTLPSLQKERWRPAIDQKRLNLHISLVRFKMESLQTIIQAVPPGDWMLNSYIVT